MGGSIVLYLGVLGVLALVIALCVFASARRERDRTVRCARCWYELEGCDPRTTPVCPECGTAFEERGITFATERGSVWRRRACAAVALLCALAMGVLVLLRFPPVMQTEWELRQGTFTGFQLRNPIDVEERWVEHPAYITSPIVYFIPSLHGPDVLEDSFLLTRAGSTGDTVDVHTYPGALSVWCARNESTMSEFDKWNLSYALDTEGLDVAVFKEAIEVPRGNINLQRHFRMIHWSSHTSSATSPQSALARRLALAPSIGADWERTTWLQLSNFVWYGTPAVLTIGVLMYLRRRRRRTERARGVRWLNGEGV